MNATYGGIAPAHPPGDRLAIRILRRLGWLQALAGAGVCYLFRSVFAMTLGCTHRRKSFPFTPVRRNAAPGPACTGTYVVCLDCGKTFQYDWGEMRMVPPDTARAPADARPTRVPVRSSTP
jgi:hypothetical protein